MLKIKNLQIGVGRKILVSQVNLSLKKGEAQAILGPNAAGKSSLIKGIMGLGDYKINKGEILFNKHKINRLSINQRANLGITMIFQSPPEIKGVKLKQLLRLISAKKLKINGTGKKLLNRELNFGFSGGEKKISELLQVRSLKPKLLLIDEIDSGLDLVNLKKVSQIIKKEFIDKKVSILIITHRGQIMKYLKPKLAHVMINGKIICSEPWQKVWQTIKKYGFKRCQKCHK